MAGPDVGRQSVIFAKSALIYYFIVLIQSDYLTFSLHLTQDLPVSHSVARHL